MTPTSDQLCEEWIYHPGKWPWDADRDFLILAVWNESQGRVLDTLDPEVRKHPMYKMMMKYVTHKRSCPLLAERMGMAVERCKAEHEVLREGRDG